MAKKTVKPVKKTVKKKKPVSNPNGAGKNKHLSCKCAEKSGGVKIFKNARKNPGGKMGYLGKCDVYSKPNGNVIVVTPDEQAKQGKVAKKNPSDWLKKKVKKDVKKSLKLAKKNPAGKAKPASKSTDKWIQDMDIKKGSLRDYVFDKFGKGGFEVSKKSGNYIIKPEILTKIAKDPKEDEKRVREATLAIKFNAMRGKNKKKAKK
ncbi:MAG: hypothetical protein ACYC97_02045 [Metallibacterium sp.]